MKLSQFIDLLQNNPDKPFHLILPGDTTVPHSFHITEVGYVTKKFIDCGGKVHTLQSCLLQAWIGPDNDHRLYAGKMARVLDLAKSKGVLPDGEDLDVELEYEDVVVSQYTVANFTVTDSAVVLNLAAKHTDCLAKESCLPTPLAMVGSTTGVGCCGSTGTSCC